MPDWLVQYLTNAGPTTAIVAFMWWQERRERLDMTVKLLGALENQVKLADTIRAALRKRAAAEDEDGG